MNKLQRIITLLSKKEEEQGSSVDELFPQAMDSRLQLEAMEQRLQEDKLYKKKVVRMLSSKDLYLKTYMWTYIIHTDASGTVPDSIGTYYCSSSFIFPSICKLFLREEITTLQWLQDSVEMG